MDMFTDVVHSSTAVPAETTSSAREPVTRFHVLEMRDVYGVRVTVWSNTVAYRTDILDALPSYQPSSRPASEATYTFQWSEGESAGVLSFEGYEVERGSDPRQLLATLRSHVQAVVAARAGEFSFVHAGAVSYAGRGIMLPGSSGAGKSTLVRSLLRRGATYYSDEYAVLDGEGALHPFPCPIRIKDGHGAVRTVTADSYGVPIGLQSTPIEFVVFPTYCHGMEPTLRQLDHGAAALRLIGHMPVVGSEPAGALKTAIAVTGRARCFKLEHSDSDLAADILICIMEDSRNLHARF